MLLQIFSPFHRSTATPANLDRLFYFRHRNIAVAVFGRRKEQNIRVNIQSTAYDSMIWIVHAKYFAFHINPELQPQLIISH